MTSKHTTEKASHVWRKSPYYDDVDHFAYSQGHHNGPACENCGLTFCEHCDPENLETDCPGSMAEALRRLRDGE